MPCHPHGGGGHDVPSGWSEAPATCPTAVSPLLPFHTKHRCSPPIRKLSVGKGNWLWAPGQMRGSSPEGWEEGKALQAPGVAPGDPHVPLPQGEAYCKLADAPPLPFPCRLLCHEPVCPQGPPSNPPCAAEALAGGPGEQLPVPRASVGQWGKEILLHSLAPCHTARP